MAKEHGKHCWLIQCCSQSPSTLMLFLEVGNVALPDTQGNINRILLMFLGKLLLFLIKKIATSVPLYLSSWLDHRCHPWRWVKLSCIAEKISMRERPKEGQIHQPDQSLFSCCLRVSSNSASRFLVARFYLLKSWKVGFASISIPDTGQWCICFKENGSKAKKEH